MNHSNISNTVVEEYLESTPAILSDLPSDGKDIEIPINGGIMDGGVVYLNEIEYDSLKSMGIMAFRSTPEGREHTYYYDEANNTLDYYENGDE